MKLMPCRDCGTMIARDAAGCPICARNLRAERALGKLLLLAALLLLAFVGFLIRRVIHGAVH